MNLHRYFYYASLGDFSICIRSDAIDFLNYLPLNYSYFMDWSSSNKVIIQGITESEAIFYAAQMKAYGMNIVAGVSPGSGGTTIEDIPVFDLVEQVLAIAEKIDISLIFVPPYQVLDAVKEAISTGIKRVIVLTCDVPPLDTIELVKYAKIHHTLLLGPGSDGITQPERLWLGKLKPQFYQPGKVGLIATSRDLSYEVAAELNRSNIGQSMIVSLGNDPIIGSDLSQWLSIFNEDPHTEAIIFIGQRIQETEDIILHCRDREYDKPIIAYIVGLKTPQERIFRDAVTIISNHLSASIPAVDRQKRTIDKLKKAGIKVVKKPSEIPPILSKTSQSKIKQS